MHFNVFVFIKTTARREESIEWCRTLCASDRKTTNWPNGVIKTLICFPFRFNGIFSHFCTCFVCLCASCMCHVASQWERNGSKKASTNLLTFTMCLSVGKNRKSTLTELHLKTKKIYFRRKLLTGARRFAGLSRFGSPYFYSFASKMPSTGSFRKIVYLFSWQIDTNQPQCIEHDDVIKNLQKFITWKIDDAKYNFVAKILPSPTFVSGVSFPSNTHDDELFHVSTQATRKFNWELQFFAKISNWIEKINFSVLYWQKYGLCFAFECILRSIPFKM